jgi:parallel beta-helix repeat protein
MNLILRLLLCLLLLPSLAQAVTRYVANGGAGGSNCTSGQNISTPLSSLANGLACTASGDTLLLRTGTYPGWDSNSSPLASGSSFATATTVAAYPGTCNVNACEAVTMPGLGFSSATSYVIIDGIKLDAAGAPQPVFIAGHHIRLKDMEITGGRDFGITTSELGQGGSELIRLHVHNNGTDAHFHHGIYISGDDDYLVEGCTIHDNASYGVHVFNNNTAARSDNIVVRNNRIYNNGLAGDGFGILLAGGGGNNNSAYNNLVYNNGGGIAIGPGADNKVYNNTVYQNNVAGYAQVIIGSGSVRADVRNNILNGTATLSDSGSLSVIDFNFLTDPSFVSAGSGNFHLLAISGAINHVNTADLSTVFSTDFEGNARGLGGRWDFGAYEFASSPPPAQLAFTTQPQQTPTNQTMPDVVVQVQDASGNLSSGFTGNVTIALATGSAPVAFGSTSLVSVDSQNVGYEGPRAIDGNDATFWHTEFSPSVPPHPHQIIVNLGASYTVNGFQYLRRQDFGGGLKDYEFYVSATGGTCPGAAWGAAVGSGTFPNDLNRQTAMTTAKVGQYVCLRMLSESFGENFTNAATFTTLFDPGGGGTGSLAGTLTRAAVGGIATFSGLSINAAGTYALTATSSGLATATSVAFPIGTGPTHLRFTVQPQTVLIGQTLPPISVRVEDSANNLIDTTQAVSIAIGTNPGGGILTGTVTRAAVAGVATFNDLAITIVGGIGYTFVASASGITSATSNAFSIVGTPSLPREWIAHATAGNLCAETGGDTNPSALADTALIPQANLTLVSVDSQDTGYEGALAIDGDDQTFWHTQFTGGSPGHPHQIIVNLGASYTVTAFQYLRRQDGDSAFLGGGILAYEFYVSTDGVTWGAAVASGNMADVMTRQTFQTTPKVGQYVRLIALSEVVGRPYTSMAELTVFRTTGVGGGADYVHTLACAVRAGDLRAQGILQTCALLEVSTIGAASTAILALHMGSTVLNTNDGAAITQTLTSNSWVCFDTVIAGNPGASVATYSSYLQTAPSFPRITGRGGITTQPVNVNTSIAEIASFASRWLSSSGGDDGITLRAMTMGLTK